VLLAVYVALLPLGMVAFLYRYRDRIARGDKALTGLGCAGVALFLFPCDIAPFGRELAIRTS
jgi:hypothetical protein